MRANRLSAVGGLGSLVGTVVLLGLAGVISFAGISALETHALPQWRGNVGLVVYMEPSATAKDIAKVQHSLSTLASRIVV